MEICFSYNNEGYAIIKRFSLLFYCYIIVCNLKTISMELQSNQFIILKRNK